MGRIIVFNATKIGASHIKSGKPCQDNSLSWMSEDGRTQVAIVCDGHGGDTYVRSDVGSRIAAQTALDCIRQFVDTTSPAMFLGAEGAVTARPSEEEDPLFPTTKAPRKELTESEQQQLEQDRAFYEAVEKVRKQDALFVRLFASIYMQWLAGIEQDAQEHPFTEAEKACLKGARLVKAYGSTLMAFVRTPLYWFAFHIGDGKLLCCDRNLQWREPVPWDCNCFLNITTSLCNTDPVPMFRYAFSGKGDFPTAVIMGSDGLDDSWGTMELLQNFYSKVLSIFNELGEAAAEKELADYLPTLSEKGSRDDMSMAGIIDMDEIKDGVEVYNVRRKLQALKKEKEKKEAELTKLKAQYDQLDQEMKKLEANVEQEKTSFTDWLQAFMLQRDDREKDLRQKEEEIQEKLRKKTACLEEHENKRTAFLAWIEQASADKDTLLAEHDSLVKANTEKERLELEHWEQEKNLFRQQEESKRQETVRAKAEEMQLHDSENLQVLKKLDENEQKEAEKAEPVEPEVPAKPAQNPEQDGEV